MRGCDEVITVFNARVDPATGLEVLSPTVLTGCGWYARRDAAVTESGLRRRWRLTARIPGDVDAGGKKYAAPGEYRAAADAGGLWTLQTGDAIVRGAATEETTPARLRERFDGAFTVLGVTDNRRAPMGRHWKVEGER